MNYPVRELTDAEQRLIKCVADGDGWWPDFLAEPNELDLDPAYAFGWPDDRRISADVIRCLLLGDRWPLRSKPWSVAARGVAIFGARITGNLELSGATLKHRLVLARCAIDEQIDLRDAAAKTIALTGSCAPGLDGTRVRISGNLTLGYGFCCYGQVNLMGARIGGQLSCRNGHFEGRGKGEYAILCNGIAAADVIFGGAQFFAEGIEIVGAKIDGQLLCENGHLTNINGFAFNGDGLSARQDVFIRPRAEGTVSLAGAQINGQLSMEDGIFKRSSRKFAINLTGIKVRQSTFIRGEALRAEGEVSLVRADIQGNLSLANAKISNRGKIALNCDSMVVGQNLFLRGRDFCVDGAVNLANAKIKGSLDCSSGTIREELDLSGASCGTYQDSSEFWPPPGKLILDGFTYSRFYESDVSWKTRLQWLLIQPPMHLGQPVSMTAQSVFRPQPWVQCYEVLRGMGYSDDARQLAIQREIIRADAHNLRWHERLWLRLLRWTVGFGYRPQLALYWSFCFFLLSWLTFATASNMGFMAPKDGSVQAYLAANPNSKLPEHYTRFNAPVFALDNFLPIIELGQDLAWEPSDVQVGERRIEYLHSSWWAEGTRLLLGHDWSITGNAVHTKTIDLEQAQSFNGTLTAQSKPRKASSVVHCLDTIAAAIACLFHLGIHRAIYWLMELLGWLFVSLYIAGMSGIMKGE